MHSQQLKNTGQKKKKKLKRQQKWVHAFANNGAGHWPHKTKNIVTDFEYPMLFSYKREEGFLL